MKRIAVLSLILFFHSSLYAYDWKAMHERADKMPPEAAKVYSADNPDSAQDKYILGLVYLNERNDRRAYEVFLSLLAEHPDMAAAAWGMAECLRRKHEVLQSEALLNKVLKKDPSFVPALLTLAYIKYFQGDFEGANRLASKIIRMGKNKVDLSNYVRAYCLYGGTKGMIAHYGGPLSKIINGPAAKSNLDAAQKMQPDNPAVLFGLGSYYLLAPVIAGGDKAKAEDYLKKARKADPLFADIYVRLAQLASIKGEKEKYKFYMGKALEIDPENELALDTLSGRCRFVCTGGEE